MIIAEIVGGLANQMVIYAAGRALAEHKGTDLKLDLGALGRDKLRKYVLHHLQITGEIATPEEIFRIRKSSKFKLVEKLKTKLRKKLKLKVEHIYKEPFCSFDPNFWDLPADVHISGNFISSRYFAPVAPALRHEFRVSSPLSRQTKQYESAMQNKNSICIHIRRGDYAANEHTKRFHGLIGLEHFTRAMAFIEERVAEPVYYVFSDDPEWALQNLTSVHPLFFVSHNNGDHDYEDMYLMSRCRHNIIANSGFGYWGAWLNENPDKIVVAPREWFGDQAFNNAFDMIPPDWARI